MASDLWLFDLEGLDAVRVTDWEGTDTQPMWHGEDLYYLSDEGANHRLNLWKHDLASGTRTQVTNFEKYDVLWPSIGPGPTVPVRSSSRTELICLCSTFNQVRYEPLKSRFQVTARVSVRDASTRVTASATMPSPRVGSV